MKTHDSIEKALEDLVPKSLDDIIRQRRELAQLGLATEAEIAALQKVVPDPGQVRGEISDWRFVAYRVTPPGQEAKTSILLLGDLEQQMWMTSPVLALDLGSKIALTRSGSAYRVVGPRGEGEPSMHQLMHVCSTLWKWGSGELLGVPHFFY